MKIIKTNSNYGDGFGSSISINRFQYQPNTNECYITYYEEMDGVSYPYSYDDCNPIITQTKKTKGSKIHHLAVGVSGKNAVYVYNLLEDDPLTIINNNSKGFGKSVCIYKNWIAVANDDFQTTGTIFFYTRVNNSDNYVLHSSYGKTINSDIGSVLYLYEDKGELFCYIGCSSSATNIFYKVLKEEATIIQENKFSRSGNDMIKTKVHMVISAFGSNSLQFYYDRNKVFELFSKDLLLDEIIYNPTKFTYEGMNHILNFEEFEKWKRITRFGESITYDGQFIYTTFISNNELFIYKFDMLTLTTGIVIKTGIELINSKPKIIFNDDLYISIENVQYNNKLYKLDGNDVILLYTSDFDNKVYEEIEQENHGFEENDVLKSGYEKITYETTVPKIEGTVYQVISKDKFILRRHIYQNDRFGFNMQSFQNKLLVSCHGYDNHRGVVYMF